MQKARLCSLRRGCTPESRRSLLAVLRTGNGPLHVPVDCWPFSRFREDLLLAGWRLDYPPAEEPGQRGKIAALRLVTTLICNDPTTPTIPRWTA